MPEIFFTWSYPDVPVRGGKTTYDDGTAADEADTCSAGFALVFPSIKLMRSSLVTLPPFPVAGTVLISILFALAKNLEAGVERALD